MCSASSRSAEATALPDAAALSRALTAGEATSERVTRQCLDAIAARDEKLQAFITVYNDTAPVIAKALDQMASVGQRLSPWHGIPIALKDLFDVVGRETTAGSQAWRGRIADRTATVVQRLQRAGLVVLGKTQAVEFALGGWGTHETMTTPWNPWDANVHRVPGGSSSGSAVAVAAGLVPWALGTDTGGSIRMPAAFCGLTGFKPTTGRISTHGVVPLSRTMDTVGPLTRSVADAAALYLLLQGHDDADPLTHHRPADTTAAAIRLGMKGLRIARMPDAERSGVAPDVLAAYDRTLQECEAAGAIVEPIELPCLFQDYFANNARIVSAEGFAEFRRYAEDDSLPLDPVVRARVLGGGVVSAGDFLQAFRTREADMAAFHAAFAPFDALLTPTTANTAIAIDAIDPNNQPSRFTRVANYLDLCALAVPNGLDRAGLPTSVQIICKQHADAIALRIGAAYQRATDWHLARPAEQANTGARHG